MNKEASEEPVKFASKARGSIVCVCVYPSCFIVKQ